MIRLTFTQSIHLVAAILMTSAFCQEDIDWFDIAENTDTPAICGVVASVNPGSPAEQRNMKAGDMIGLLNDCYYGYNKVLPKEPYEIEIMSAETGATRVEAFPSGLMGIKVDFQSQPWLNYLRDELGTRGRWDEDMVDFMVALFEGRKLPPEDDWNAILDQGYPEDDALFDLIELVLAWKRGEPIQPHFFINRWEAELTPMPHTVFHILERLAWVSNDRQLWQNLAKIDQNNLRISQSDLEAILSQPELSKQRTGSDFLTWAESIRGRKIERQCRPFERNWKMKGFLAPKPKSVANGHYQIYKMLPPKLSTKEVHYRMVYRPLGHDISTRWVASVRMGIYQYNPKTKKGGNRIGEISLIRSADGTRVESKGNGIDYVYKLIASPVNFPINQKGKPQRDIRKSPRVVMDVVATKKECAVFLNGQSFGHWQAPKNSGGIYMTMFMSGIKLNISEFSIWELNTGG